MTLKTKKSKIFFATVFIFGLIILSGCGFKQKTDHQYNLSLEIWGPFDYGDALRKVFNSYKKINPNISSLEYKRIPINTYQKELTEALAAGQGPDIFFIRNDWVPSFADKIVPVKEIPGVISEKKFRANFVDVVANDFLVKGNIYAMPLSVDTLGLYYNKDLFNQAGIVAPPKTWDEFSEDVKKLTKINAFGEIIQSGAAMGTAYNINRSTDILNLLMLQNQTKMIDPRGQVLFQKSISENGKSIFPGENALAFYTQFANTSSPEYTWNSQLHYSIDAFSEGTVAMMLNYPWNVKVIKEKAPKLNFAIAPVPQIKDKPKVNFANYWGLAVSKNKTPQSNPYGQSKKAVVISSNTRLKEAWTFLTYLTTKPDGTFNNKASTKVGQVTEANFDPAKSCLTQTGEPAARRDLIKEQKDNPTIGVFATDNLIAQSWIEVDPSSIESIFAEMIDQVNKGQATVAGAIKTAAQRVQILSNNN